MTETFIPASSNLSKCSYDRETKTLTVEFLDSRTYEYSGVPPEVWFGLQHAPSAGSYLFRNIRDRYPYQEV